MATKHKNEATRLYKSNFIEALSRSPFWLPLVVFIPAIVYFLYTGFSTVGKENLVGGALMSVLGLGAWTLSEYLIHRFIFHYEAKSKFWKRFIYVVHGVHHDHPNDLTRLVFPIIVSIPMVTLIFFLSSLIPWGQAGYHSIFFAFYVLSYLSYDMIHYATHAISSENKIFVAIKKHHMSHHYKTSNSKFGVSSGFWDYIFRSLGSSQETK